MNIVLQESPATPAIRPTPSYLDILEESYDHIDPTTGRVLWNLSAADEALEMELQDEANDAYGYAPFLSLEMSA